MRLPQTAMSHQSRLALRLRSRKSQPQLRHILMRLDFSGTTSDSVDSEIAVSSGSGVDELPKGREGETTCLEVVSPRAQACNTSRSHTVSI